MKNFKFLVAFCALLTICMAVTHSQSALGKSPPKSELVVQHNNVSVIATNTVECYSYVGNYTLTSYRYMASERPIVVGILPDNYIPEKIQQYLYIFKLPKTRAGHYAYLDGAKNALICSCRRC